jgi:hypothetical protein
MEAGTVGKMERTNGFCGSTKNGAHFGEQVAAKTSEHPLAAHDNMARKGGANIRSHPRRTWNIKVPEGDELLLTTQQQKRGWNVATPNLPTCQGGAVVHKTGKAKEETKGWQESTPSSPLTESKTVYSQLFKHVVLVVRVIARNMKVRWMDWEKCMTEIEKGPRWGNKSVFKKEVAGKPRWTNEHGDDYLLPSTTVVTIVGVTIIYVTRSRFAFMWMATLHFVSNLRYLSKNEQMKAWLRKNELLDHSITFCTLLFFLLTLC